MSEIQEIASVKQCDIVSEDIALLTINSPQIASTARPGQFVMVRCSSVDDPLLRRPFSIHNTSPDGTIQILFKIIGRGTAILSRLQPGQSISLIGPLGKGFEFSRSGPVCLLGGGMGIAPLYLLAKQLQEKHKYNDIVLLGAARGCEVTGLNDQFIELGMQVQCATDDGSFGHHGFVTELLSDLDPSVQKVFACGPFPMMKIVAAYCKEQNINCQVSLETHMACGLGACLGCTIHGSDGKYRHVCKHGPVFNGLEVAWEK